MAKIKEELTGGSGRGRGRGLAARFLAPIVAGAASAAASYAVAKGPELFEKKVLPRLREAMQGAGGAAQDLPSRVKSAAGDAGGVAERLTDRARSVAGTALHSNGEASGGRRRSRIPADELERRRKARAQGRAERRRTAR